MEKTKDLKKLITEINQTNKEKHQVIPTNIKSLDYILGGGFELGSKVQIVAESSTGKSTIALQISKNFCKQGFNVLYIDSENSITKELLKSTGSYNYYEHKDDKIGELVIIKESDFDTVSNKLDICLKSNYFKLIIIDSLASLVNNCYVDIENTKSVKLVTNNNTNYESRPLNLFINKFSCLANKYNVIFLFVNQYRNKVDPLKGTILKEYGNKIVRYNSDIIIKLKKEKTILWQDENGLFNENDYSSIPATHAKLTFILDKSNKMLTGTCIESYIKFGYGIDDCLDKILNDIRNNNNIEKNGKYYYLKSENIKLDGFINLINHIVSSKTSKIIDDISDSFKLDDEGKLEMDF